MPDSWEDPNCNGQILAQDRQPKGQTGQTPTGQTPTGQTAHGPDSLLAVQGGGGTALIAIPVFFGEPGKVIIDG